LRNRREFLFFAIFLFLVFACLASSAHNLIKQLERFNKGPDQVCEYEKKLLKMKSLLPARGVVGYVSSTNQKDINVILDPKGTEDYFQFQYVLAPLILLNRSDLPFVVGNIQGNEVGAITKVAAKKGLTVKAEFGSGIVLFVKK
jgi:hypothetical protein